MLEPKDVIVCANQAAMVFEIHVTLAGGSTMIIDAVEVFDHQRLQLSVVDDFQLPDDQFHARSLAVNLLVSRRRVSKGGTKPVGGSQRTVLMEEIDMGSNQDDRFSADS